MATTSRRAKLMRGRLAAALVALGAVVGLGVASASPPPSAAFDAFDGRTWLAVPRAEGSQLLLVNGISGSLEAEAILDPAPSSVDYVGATARRTLLRTPDSLIVVDNATHAVVRRPLAAADRVALVGDDVLVVGERVERVGTSSDAKPRAVAGAPAPVADAPVVVDGRGQPWYLGRQADGSTVAVAVAADASADDADTRALAVPGSTRTLVVVDGRVHAVGDTVVSVEGGGRPIADVDGLTPTIAHGTGGAWATASESTLTVVRDGEEKTSDLGQDITDLALWHGSAYAVTASGLTQVTADAENAVPEIGGGAALHVDGGLLWATTPEIAVAIDPDQGQVVLRLASADLSLCVGDCSAAAASTFLEQAASDAPPPAPAPPEPAPGKASPTTTEAPRTLEAAVVTPTLPSTTVPRSAAATTTTTRPPPTASPAPGPAPEAAPETTIAGVPPASTSTTTTSKEKDKDVPPPRQDPVPVTLPRPVDPKPTTSTTVSTTTSTTDGPTTTATPDDPVDLEYSLRGGRGSATADIRVLARPSACGSTGVATTGTVSWTGSDSGSREVLITWSQPDSRRSHETSATIVAPAGELEVTVTVCGVAATRQTTIEGDPIPTTTTTTSTTTTPTSPPTTAPTTMPPTTTPTTVPTTTTPTTPTTVPPPPTTTTTVPTTTPTTPGSTTTTTQPTSTTRPPATVPAP